MLKCFKGITLSCISAVMAGLVAMVIWWVRGGVRPHTLVRACVGVINLMYTYGEICTAVDQQSAHDIGALCSCKWDL